MTPAVPPTESHGTSGRTLAVVATEWGPTKGGINAFNLDFCLALGRLLKGSARVICLTGPVDHLTQADVAKEGVEILSLPKIDFDDPPSTVEAATRLLQMRGIERLDLTIGHDVFSGPIATGLRARFRGTAAVIHHMSYGAYQAIRKDGKTALQMEEEQRQLLREADSVLAVGPLLRDSAQELCQTVRQAKMIIPGFADITPVSVRSEDAFRAIAFGRMGGEDDRIKQGKLAAAGYGRFARQARELNCRYTTRFNVFGLSEEKEKYNKEETALKSLVWGEAKGMVSVMAHPYLQDRKKLFDELARNEAALMLSWHEGFGLVGWEAIAAQVPLVISKATGLYALLKSDPDISEAGCVSVVEVRGSDTETLREDDVVAVAEALMGIAANLAEQLRRAGQLRDTLRSKFTWEDCARVALDACGWAGLTSVAPDTGGTPPAPHTGGTTVPEPAGGVARDVERLRQLTRSTHDSQAHLSMIRVGSSTVKILRPTTSALSSFAQDASLLVVGEPGAGKSGAQHDLVTELLAQKKDVVLLAVDHLASESLGELRGELGLEHELIEVLKAWTGPEQGFLVIDALDAARSDGSAQALRTLMTQTLALAARWRVIASVRKYDLRYGQEFQRLFAGAPHTVFFDPIFRNVRHLNIPPLDDDELKQIASQSPQLADLVEAASGALRELLRVPFNLSLAASLLEGGITVAELTPVRTQLELLDRYWDARVRREDRLGDAREAVLRLAVEEMVRRRSLRAPRSAVASDPAASTHLHDILSANVLVEWQPPHAAKPDQSLLAFSHHVLYDYAVERLLLRGEPADLVSRLESSPDLALAIRPSLVLHFQHVWAQGPDRKAFWALVERIERSNQVPDIAKTIGPTVAKEMFRTLDDLSPVFGPLEASDEH